MILIAVLAGLLSTVGIGFFLAGAWPVIGFLGLEFLVVWGAFKLNYNAAKVRETVETTTESLTIKHTDKTGKSKISKFSIGWLRVNVSPTIAPKTSARYQQRVILSSHGVEAEIGAFLHPSEKIKLGHEINSMVNRSRANRDSDAKS